MEKTLALIASALPSPDRADVKDRAIAVFSTLIGALQLSRALADSDLSQQALDAGVKAALAVGASNLGRSGH
jgi:hypothetical protein